MTHKPEISIFDIFLYIQLACNTRSWTCSRNFTSQRVILLLLAWAVGLVAKFEDWYMQKLKSMLTSTQLMRFCFLGQLTVNKTLHIYTCTNKLVWHSIVGSSWSWSYGSWIYNYLCNQCLSPQMLRMRISIRARCTTLCDKVCQWLATGRWFSPGTPVSTTNNTDCHDITEILLEMALNTIKPNQPNKVWQWLKIESDIHDKLTDDDRPQWQTQNDDNRSHDHLEVRWD